MQLFAILRRNGWDGPEGPEGLEAAKARSEQARDAMPGRIGWVRTYVTAEPSGKLGTICLYEAADEASVREHAKRAGLPADEVLPIVKVDTPEPPPAQ